MSDYVRPEHRIIDRLLRGMDSDLLTQCRCWFGGGTAIVLKYGEYRRSLDLDFLCSDQEGYRELRNRAVEAGARFLFSPDVSILREIRTDQYGIRCALELAGQPIRFEIVREARIDLQGDMDLQLGVPTLISSDMVAEKLLANADRCQDPATCFRDAFDLGILAGRIADWNFAIAKAKAAYGADIGKKIDWALSRLAHTETRRLAADQLMMSPEVAAAAISALADKVRLHWPSQTSP